MRVKKRVFEQVNIPTYSVVLKSNLENDNIYFIHSKTIEIKGSIETLSLFANLTYGDKDKENISNNNDLLYTPESNNPLEFTVGTDEVFNNDEIDNNSQGIVSDTKYVSINFFIEIEGVFYSVDGYSYDISIKELEPLFNVFNKKEALDKERFLMLVSNNACFSDLYLKESDVKDIFKKGNIDLSMSEIYNNRDSCTIKEISVKGNHAEITLDRFGGNQVIYYLLDSQINMSLYNCLDVFSSKSIDLDDFTSYFSVQKNKIISPLGIDV